MPLTRKSMALTRVPLSLMRVNVVASRDEPGFVKTIALAFTPPISSRLVLPTFGS
jgi:hypothetical protein